MRFRKAEPADADFFPELEQSAGLSFRADHELAWLADADNLSAEKYREIIRKGWSWLAENELAHPIAFVAATLEKWAIPIWGVREAQVGKGLPATRRCAMRKRMLP